MQPTHPYRWLLAGVLFALLLPSCKKRDTPAPQGTGNINDSIFFIFKDIYLWTDVIPDSATFRPHSYSSTNTMFEALTQFKKNDAGATLDRYSFLDDGTTSRALQEGIVGNVGFEVGFQTDTTIYVVYVYPGSPASKAGVKRGWKVTTINGVSKFNYQDNATNDLLNQSLGGTNASFSFLKPDGNTQTSTLSAVDYNLDPILYSNIFDFNGTKVGYFVFNNFVALEDVKPKMDSIFTAFTNAGIKNLVVDLRYNGGGLLETAEYLANKLVPAAKSNTVMYTQSFNNNVNTDNYSAYFKNMKARPNYPAINWTDIFHNEATQYKTATFKKQGALELSKISFLATHNTVSASELLYNVLKPSMNPALIGRQTYGKPVGFINITFGQYDMYAACFQTFNSAGEGNYFDGLPPTVDVRDDYTTDWGDLSDPLLHSALLDMGIPSNQLGRMALLSTNRLGVMVNALRGATFRGMIENRINR
ncbi:S41 family peptidase [Chitinophaga sp. MM2321]|uniref:S41 family peptidase n=1 Tax=Chitinophaga sp. MM2321 TaxID=3137178 RepID=UPI0032D56BFE